MKPAIKTRIYFVVLFIFIFYQSCLSILLWLTAMLTGLFILQNIYKRKLSQLCGHTHCQCLLYIRQHNWNLPN